MSRPRLTREQKRLRKIRTKDSRKLKYKCLFYVLVAALAIDEFVEGKD